MDTRDIVLLSRETVYLLVELLALLDRDGGVRPEELEAVRDRLRSQAERAQRLYEAKKAREQE